VIRALIPSRLEYRDLAIRLVASACKLVPRGGDDFANEVVSAFSEALNNVVLHGGGVPGDEIEIEIDLADDGLTLRLKDYGASFDPDAVPTPDLDTLPESGLGVFIIRSFMDDVSYEPGRPNVLAMTKRVGEGRR
jgi:serine/threonine-protein kinase RsbW